MAYRRIESIKLGKQSYTKDQKENIIASLEQTKSTFMEFISGLNAQIEEVKNAPLREHKIGEEI